MIGWANCPGTVTRPYTRGRERERERERAQQTPQASTPNEGGSRYPVPPHVAFQGWDAQSPQQTEATTQPTWLATAAAAETAETHGTSGGGHRTPPATGTTAADPHLPQPAWRSIPQATAPPDLAGSTSRQQAAAAAGGATAEVEAAAGVQTQQPHPANAAAENAEATQPEQEVADAETSVREDPGSNRPAASSPTHAGAGTPHGKQQRRCRAGATNPRAPGRLTRHPPRIPATGHQPRPAAAAQGGTSAAAKQARRKRRPPATSERRTNGGQGAPTPTTPANQQPRPAATNQGGASAAANQAGRGQRPQTTSTYTTGDRGHPPQQHQPAGSWNVAPAFTWREGDIRLQLYLPPSEGTPLTYPPVLP